MGHDILAYVMCVIPASRSQIAWLSILRLVCQHFKQAVDTCRQNSEWTGPLAADFRDDGVVHPPLLLNRGIERMLLEEQWQPLIEGMNEYNSDCTTQEIIITRLMQTLAGPMPKAYARACKDALDKYGAHGTVAWAMRTHPNSRTIQLNGCHLLNLIVDEEHALCSTPYIVGSLAAVMRANMQDLELLRTCVEILEKMLDEVHIFFSDAEEALSEDGSGSRKVINMSALIQAGVHNVPNLLICAMRQHMNDYNFQRDAAELFYAFAGVMNRLTDRTCMKDFDMHEAETVLIASMHQHSHQSDELPPSVQENCHFALHSLMEFDSANMGHIQEAIQATINAAMQNSGEFMEWMITMLCTLMQALVTSPLETQRMQNFAADSGMVQMYIVHILNGVSIDWMAEDDTYDAFTILIWICEGNASTSEKMVQADVVRTIDSAPPISPKSARWHAARAKLVAILGLLQHITH